MTEPLSDKQWSPTPGLWVRVIDPTSVYFNDTGNVLLNSMDSSLVNVSMSSHVHRHFRKDQLEPLNTELTDESAAPYHITQVVTENGQLAERVAALEHQNAVLRQFMADMAKVAPGQPTAINAYGFWVAGQQARALLMALDELDRAAAS